MTAETDFRFDPVEKDPAESLPVELQWFNLCANFWRANEQYGAAEYVRPNVATGFAYQASGAGTSGAREPRWPTTLALTVVDGSITWTCTTASANGLNALSAPSGVSDPTGITISSVSVSESTKVLATYAGGTDGQDYDAVFTVTLNGVSRVARQTINVRRR
jgi:hypothetical protein